MLLKMTEIGSATSGPKNVSSRRECWAKVKGPHRLFYMYPAQSLALGCLLKDCSYSLIKTPEQTVYVPLVIIGDAQVRGLRLWLQLDTCPQAVCGSHPVINFGVCVCNFGVCVSLYTWGYLASSYQKGVTLNQRLVD